MEGNPGVHKVAFATAEVLKAHLQASISDSTQVCTFLCLPLTELSESTSSIFANSTPAQSAIGDLDLLDIIQYELFGKKSWRASAFHNSIICLCQHHLEGTELTATRKSLLCTQQMSLFSPPLWVFHVVLLNLAFLKPIKCLVVYGILLCV